MKRIGADSLLLLVTFFWGSTFVLVQDAIERIPFFAFLAIRFTLAGIVLLAITLSFPRYRRQLRSLVLWRHGAWLAVWLFCGYALQTWGLLYTTPAKSGFITGLCVVLVPLLSVLWLRQRPARASWIGVGLSTFGLYLLSHGGAQGFTIGDLMTLGCAISFAVQIVAVGIYAPKHAALPLASVQILCVGLFSFVASLPEHVHWATVATVSRSPIVLWAILICTLFATVLAYFAQTAIQRYTTTTRTVLIFSMEPVFAAVVAYWFAGDALTLISGIGCLLILGGMLVAELFRSGETLPV